MRAHTFERERIKRVVVRGTNWVGDAVLTTPALRELRRVLPDAHITLATRSWAKGLFADADFLDDLLVYDRGARDLRAVWRQTAEWRRRRFDLAVLFQNAFEAALIARAARVPLRLGYATDGRRSLLTHPLTVPPWRGERHEVFYYLNIVAELERLIDGASGVLDSEPAFALQVSEQRRREARERLRAEGVGLSGAALVALCPGSTNSRAKRWPTERYASLADMLIESIGADVALIGSRDEESVSQEVAARMRHRPLMLTGRTELSEVVAVLSVADLLVTNDTGPAHISAALERPTLVIFGPTIPATTGPFSRTAEIIRRPPDCAPCMLRDCPIDHRCMTAITAEEVFERALVMLNRKTVAEVGQ
ncbi:MAG TPA: lipopolysaccharide heptosyltransferase II [Pyrinomonadaceae bacterium]|nr:lipopolysaccharide heptosyltransferase II [Pyrinomonadaceae bacterium]